MLTTFGRQVVTGIALLGLAALLSLFFLTSQGRALTMRGWDVACREAGACIEVYRR